MNPARSALTRAVNKAIANGTPVYTNIPAHDDYVALMTLSDGTLCMVEPPQPAGLDRRVFRICGDGYEWAHWHDVQSNGARARWYGYASKELPATMTRA